MGSLIAHLLDNYLDEVVTAEEAESLLSVQPDSREGDGPVLLEELFSSLPTAGEEEAGNA